jgi:hypothetical protein
MQNDTSMRLPTEAEKRAQDMWERSAAFAMDKGWDCEVVGLSMLTAAQKILSQMYPPDQMVFVLGRLAYEWEKLSGVDRAESGDDASPSSH